MATFLELCRAVANESGTLEGDRPLTTAGQTGRLALVVSWVRQGWVDIQNVAQWRFLKRPIPETAELVAGTRFYTAASFGITDHQSWIVGNPTPLSVFPAGGDQGVESRLVFLDFEDWYLRFDYGSGAAETGKPVYVSLDSDLRLCIGPAPDANYRLRGRYGRKPQVLAADAEVPIMPDQYHEAIKWKAISLLVEFDEADRLVIATAERSLNSYLGAMRRDLLPRGGPYIDATPLGGQDPGSRYYTGAFGSPPLIPQGS